MPFKMRLPNLLFSLPTLALGAALIGGFALGRGLTLWGFGISAVAIGLGGWLYRSVIRPFERARSMAEGLGASGELREVLATLSSELQSSRAAQRELDEMIDTMAGALILVDVQRRMIRVNPAAQTLTGFDEKELLGQSLDIVFPEQQPINTGSLVQLSADGRMRNVEKAFRHRDGTEIPVLFSGSVLRGEDGVARQFVCVAYDIRRNKEIEARLQASLREKELLLREVHHRVKNNLQVISSLLDLQSQHLKDPQDLELIRDSRHRIRSMALIHEQLYRHDDLSDVKLGPYLENIAGHLFRSYGVAPGRIILRCRLDELAIDLDRAVSCGLIVNELVSNSLEHAFPGEATGEIRIELGRAVGDDGRSLFRLAVIDDGRGFDVDAERSQSMGLELVSMMAQQLRGRVVIQSRQGNGHEGSRFAVEFPESPDAGMKEIDWISATGVSTQ